MQIQSPTHLSKPYPLLYPGTTPAAGANFTWTTVNRTITELIAFRFTFTTDANVANRNITISLTNSGTTFLTLPCQNTITASLARAYNFYQGCPVYGTLIQGTTEQNALPERLLLTGPCTLIITVANIQAGDQLDNILITTNRWVNTTL